jgi:DUF218 domain
VRARALATAIGGLALLAAAAATAADTAHRWAAGSKYRGSGDQSTEAIIVLGYKSRLDGQPHPIQRWRCEIAVRSMDPRRSSTLIMSGARGEAQTMAGFARDVLGVPADRIVLEERAKTTWENIAFSLPLAEKYDAIKIASDPLHVRRARRYVGWLRPDLLPRLEPAADYRPFEHPLLKTGTLLYEFIRPPVRRFSRESRGKHERR